MNDDTAQVKISIDCMGGDFGIPVTVPASVAFLKQEPSVHLYLVGKSDEIEAELNRQKVSGHSRITVVHASEVVEMDDKLETAMRRKRDSSMRKAIRLVDDGTVDACVSAGNTGALMALSRYVLKTMPGVDRPAICAIFPNILGGPTYVLDLGANVDCEAEHLHQFALMGSALFEYVEGKIPSIGLLNVGSEDIKGNDVVKQAGEILTNDGEAGKINFYGNVEGNDIFKGTVDVVVIDGFTGNVMLKAVEGMGRMFRDVLVSELKSSIVSMCGALLAKSALKKVGERLNPSRFNGACMLGLRGLVFKSHGGADQMAYEYAVRRAFDAVKQNALTRISEAMERFSQEKTQASDQSA